MNIVLNDAVETLVSYDEPDPIRSLRSEAKYLQAMIGGNIYFVSLDERIPQGTTFVTRDKDPRSLIGIPKASDGFTWQLIPSVNPIHKIVPKTAPFFYINIRQKGP